MYVVCIPDIYTFLHPPHRATPSPSHLPVYCIRALTCEGSLISNKLAECTKLFMESSSIPGDCASLYLSKVLGTFVLLGSLAFKVPQILKLHKNKSAAGIHGSVSLVQESQHSGA